MLDLDGDGFAEILFLEGHDPVYYEGLQNLYKVSTTGELLFSWQGSVNGWFPLGTVINDINNDGIKEVVMSANDSETVSIIDSSSFTTTVEKHGLGRVIGSTDSNEACATPTVRVRRR